MNATETNAADGRWDQSRDDAGAETYRGKRCGMKTQPHYVTAADALADWQDALFSGAAPMLYTVGTGALGHVELGPGRVLPVGGIPGGGKTALSMQLVIDALRAAPTLRAIVANVEMTPTVLLDRQLARVAGVPLDAIARRRLDASHADRIDRGLAMLETIADRLAFVAPPYDLGNIAATADDFGGGLLTLDYLQRIRPPGEHTDRRGSVDALMDYLRQFADAGCAETGRSRCPAGSGGRIGTLERPDRHESRRARPFLLESSSSSGYDCGLRFDKWEMSVENMGDDLSAECPPGHCLPQRAIALSDLIRLLNKPGPRGKDVLPGR